MQNRFSASGLYEVQYFKANYETGILLSHNETLILTVTNQDHCLKLIVIIFLIGYKPYQILKQLVIHM